MDQPPPPYVSSSSDEDDQVDAPLPPVRRQDEDVLEDIADTPVQDENQEPDLAGGPQAKRRRLSLGDLPDLPSVLSDFVLYIPEKALEETHQQQVEQWAAELDAQIVQDPQSDSDGKTILQITDQDDAHTFDSEYPVVHMRWLEDCSKEQRACPWVEYVINKSS